MPHSVSKTDACLIFQTVSYTNSAWVVGENLPAALISCDSVRGQTTTTQAKMVLREWLCTHQLSQDHRRERLEEALAAECRSRHIEPPTPERIARLIRSAIRTFETRLYATTLGRLSPANRRELDALLYDLADLSDSADPPDRSAAAAPDLPSPTHATSQGTARATSRH